MSGDAIDGRIDLGGAYMSEGVEEAIIKVLRSGWPGPGPLAEQFETAFAEYCGGKYPVAVNSCTAALHLAVRLLNLKPGREVITTPITFVATNQVILYEQLVPVFADIEADTGNVCVESMESKITERTGALMVMHYGGYPCDLDAIYALAERHGLQLIEDCAHAAGSTYKGRRIGSHNSLQAFSFQSTKNLSAVDGGLLFTRSEEEADRARRLRWMGIDSSTHARTTQPGRANRYDISELGYRYAMSDLNAAIALAQLPHLDEGNASRAAIANRYKAAFAGLESIRTLATTDDRSSSHHLFAILSTRRDELAASLRARQIITGTHYQRNDRYGIFKSADVPAAERFANQVLTLPIHPRLKDRDIERVIAAITELA
ncbi:MAG: DegT/DnrJ/EryC1/StrS family aminotransferase [Halioglobus sp.]|nr:DegT/DnrJ/EryC1/StrS family aminotransferase [Halioglobus sp.]